jgi:hypothetical protein
MKYYLSVVLFALVMGGLGVAVEAASGTGAGDCDDGIVRGAA